MGITLELDKMSTTEKFEVLDEILSDLSENVGIPIILSLNSGGEVVVQDSNNYRELLETRDRLQALRGIQKGMTDLKEGRTSPSEEFFDEFFTKYDIPTKK